MAPSTTAGPEASETALAAAADLEAQGRHREAIEVLSRVARDRRSAAAEEHLVRLRHEAFAHLDPRPDSSTWPPEVPDRFAGETGLAEVAAEDLTSGAVASGLVHHGSLVVRSLVPPRWIDVLVEDIDRAIDGRRAWKDGTPPSETSPWFAPLRPAEGYASLGNARGGGRDANHVLIPDSPRGLADVVALYDEIGIREVVAGYLGEPPALSAKKSVFRRIPPDLATADWHQDGAFLDLGDGLRTVNVWVALSHCGVDAPGLDLVPFRVDEIVETGTNGAHFQWSVGPGTIDALTAGAPVARPVFAPGDVVFFDEYNLHRTALSEGMTRPRYAIESWFFAPSKYPPHHVPLVF